MFVWFVWYKYDDAWGSFVIAKSKGRAKSRFQDYWRAGEFTDVRCKKIKSADGYEEGVYDDQCQTLDELGLQYLTEEEMECLEEW